MKRIVEYVAAGAAVLALGSISIPTHSVIVEDSIESNIKVVGGSLAPFQKEESLEIEKTILDVSGVGVEKYILPNSVTTSYNPLVNQEDKLSGNYSGLENLSIEDRIDYLAKEISEKNEGMGEESRVVGTGGTNIDRKTLETYRDFGEMLCLAENGSFGNLSLIGDGVSSMGWIRGDASMTTDSLALRVSQEGGSLWSCVDGDGDGKREPALAYATHEKDDGSYTVNLVIFYENECSIKVGDGQKRWRGGSDEMRAQDEQKRNQTRERPRNIPRSTGKYVRGNPNPKR